MKKNNDNLPLEEINGTCRQSRVFQLDDIIRRALIKPLQLIGAGTFPLYEHERIAVSERRHQSNDV
jgi:hypothetical protein